MTKIDLDLARNTYKDEIEQMIIKHGNASVIPPEERFLAGEKLRAAYCINTSPETPVVAVFKHYAVDQRVWQFFTDEPIDTSQKKIRRSDQYSNALAWAEDNVGAEVTLEQVGNAGDMSVTMAKKLIESRPDVFWKLKRGIWQIRDPKADRAAEKEALEKAEESHVKGK